MQGKHVKFDSTFIPFRTGACVSLPPACPEKVSTVCIIDVTESTETGLQTG